MYSKTIIMTPERIKTDKGKLPAGLGTEVPKSAHDKAKEAAMEEQNAAPKTKKTPKKESDPRDRPKDSHYQRAMDQHPGGY